MRYQASPIVVDFIMYHGVGVNGPVDHCMLDTSSTSTHAYKQNLWTSPATTSQCLYEVAEGLERGVGIGGKGCVHWLLSGCHSPSSLLSESSLFIPPTTTSLLWMVVIANNLVLYGGRVCHWQDCVL